jgi:hypothetical protein
MTQIIKQDIIAFIVYWAFHFLEMMLYKVKYLSQLILLPVLVMILVDKL